MRVIGRSEAEAVKASRRTLLPAGMHDAEIRDASEQPAKRGKEMITLAVIVRDADGIERELRDYLSDAPLCSARLRHACAAHDDWDEETALSNWPSEGGREPPEPEVAAEMRAERQARLAKRNKPSSDESVT